MLYTPPQKMSRAENESEGERKEFLTHPGPAESTQRSNIYPRPHVLNGRLHDVYSEQMVTFNAIFAIIMLAQLLLLYLYVTTCLFRSSTTSIATPSPAPSSTSPACAPFWPPSYYC